MQTRRDFLKTSLLGTGGLVLGGLSLDAALYARAKKANDTVRVGIVGFSDRCRSSLIPSFMNHAEELGFDIVAVSDIWKRRREEAAAFFQKNYGKEVKLFRNNEEMYESGMCDAVIISTADFQHAPHLVEALQAGCDAYCETGLSRSVRSAVPCRIIRRLAISSSPASSALS